MNKKLIIAAVSAAIVAPVASYAETTATGRVRSTYSDSNAPVSATDATEVGSNVNTDIRIGLKASTELDTGLTAHGKIELRVKPDDGSSLSTRISQVGVSGEFGNVQVGQMWSGYFNTFGTMVSIGNHHSTISDIGRTPNTIQYSNSFGPASLYVDVRANDKPDSGQTAQSGLGVGLALNPIDALTIGLATDTAKLDAGEDTKHTGIAARYTLGSGLFGTLGIQKVDDGTPEVEKQILWVGGPIASGTKWLLGYYTTEVEGSSDKAKENIWGIYHKIGGGLSIHYEGNKADAGTAGSKAVNAHTLGMTISF